MIKFDIIKLNEVIDKIKPDFVKGGKDRLVNFYNKQRNNLILLIHLNKIVDNSVNEPLVLILKELKGLREDLKKIKEVDIKKK